MSFLQSTFLQGSKLEVLSLKNNEINDLMPNTFEQLVKLTHLSLSNNKLVTIKGLTFAGLQNLSSLDLDANPVSEFEEKSLLGCTRLKKLNLSNMTSNETDINNRTFLYVPHLQDLNLASSPSIAADIINSKDILRSLGNLKKLNLKNNNLERMPDNFEVMLHDLETLQLAGNNWKCEETTWKLRDWMLANPELFTDSEKVMCDTPEYLNGRIIRDMTDEDFLPTTITTPLATTNPTTIQSMTTALPKNITFLGSLDNETETEIIIKPIFENITMNNSTKELSNASLNNITDSVHVKYTNENFSKNYTSTPVINKITQNNGSENTISFDDSDKSTEEYITIPFFVNPQLTNMTVGNVTNAEYATNITSKNVTMSVTVFPMNETLGSTTFETSFHFESNATQVKENNTEDMLVKETPDIKTEMDTSQTNKVNFSPTVLVVSVSVLIGVCVVASVAFIVVRKTCRTRRIVFADLRKSALSSHRDSNDTVFIIRHIAGDDIESRDTSASNASEDTKSSQLTTSSSSGLLPERKTEKSKYRRLSCEKKKKIAKANKYQRSISNTSTTSFDIGGPPCDDDNQVLVCAWEDHVMD